ncbi:MAG TPA: PAS domain S-box protein [Thermomicrobiales bacterium]|nr:PAS domain S-box protein [Thermomicrobiales bacterium]
MPNKRQLEPGLRRGKASAVNANSDRIGALVLAAQDAVLILDKTGRCIEANPAAELLLGFDRDELLRLHLSEIVAAGLKGDEAHGSYLLPPDRWRGEIEVCGKDGVHRVEAWSTEVTASTGTAYALFLRPGADRAGIEEAGARSFSIVASSTEAIIGTTLDGTITHWNPAAERVYGYRADEAIGGSVAMLAPPELANDVFGLLERVRRGERIEGYETTRMTKDGRRIEVSIGTSPVLDAAGNVVAVSSIARDVTDRKRAERQLRAANETAEGANRALRESEERFRGAFDGASIGMALVSPEGRFLEVNRALCGILGYSEDELLAKTFQDLTHPDDLDADRDQAEQLLANEISTYQVEKRYVCKDGRVAWVRVTVSLVHDAQGDPLYFVFQMQDITPYKAAGAALREAEARYRTLVEQIPAAVYVDPAGALGSPLYVSPRVETILGYAPDEWLASPELWIERIHPEDRERVLAKTTRANVTAEALSLEYRCLARDGREVWVHDEVILVRDETGAPQYWQGFMIDITDRKRSEEDLRAAKEAAEEASRLKSAFLRMATHELRTPLTIVSGYVELLASSTASRLTPEEQEFFDIAQASTKTLSRLVDDLLDLARIEAGRLDLAIRAVDIGEAITRVHRMVSVQAAAKGIDSAVAVEPDLPLIAADPDRLIQILLNLVGNAVKFTEQGHVLSTVRRADDGVEVRVTDTGIGIAPEAQIAIFDEFRQADASTTRRFGGTGLGLAIAKRLVEMQGGTLTVQSAVGVGSTFTLWLPAASPELVTDEATAEPALAH